MGEVETEPRSKRVKEARLSHDLTIGSRNDQLPCPDTSRARKLTFDSEYVKRVRVSRAPGAAKSR